MRHVTHHSGAPKRGLGASGLLAVACALASPGALAEEAPDLLNDSFQVALGTFIFDSDVEVRLDGEAGEGTPIDWGKAFGEDDTNRFRIDGQWRFGDRHALRAMWFSTNRSSSETIDEEIEWGGEVYPVGAEVESEFGFDVYQLGYEYAFLQRDTYKVSAGLGLHYTSVSASLSGMVEVSGGKSTVERSREGSVDLPLPVISVRGLWKLPHHFWAEASAQLFALQIGDYDGSLQDLKLAVTWQPKSWAGIGVAYNYFGVDVDVEKDDFNGNLNWAYQGPMIFYSASF